MGPYIWTSRAQFLSLVRSVGVAFRMSAVALCLLLVVCFVNLGLHLENLFKVRVRVSFLYNDGMAVGSDFVVFSFFFLFCRICSLLDYVKKINK